MALTDKHMTVADLIALLQNCDSAARVILNDEPVIEDDENLMEHSMQDVIGIEKGWTDGPMPGASRLAIDRDLTFSLKPIGPYLVPAVRIVGVASEPTDPARRIVFNGIEA